MTRRPRAPVVVALPVAGRGPEPILFAAYALSVRAWARVDGDPRRRLTVTLVPKPGADARGLEAAFRAELEAQERRWAVDRNNAGVLLEAARQAVLAAQGRLSAPPAPAPAAQEALTDEQQAEIDRLIAEVETEIKELKTRKEGADPDNVRATWEERHKEEG